MLLVHGEAQLTGWHSLHGILFCISDYHFPGMLGAEREKLTWPCYHWVTLEWMYGIYLHTGWPC